MTITTDDIRAWIAFAILKNKPALINAMNNTGNYVNANISDNALSDVAWNVFAQQGLAALQNVLLQVPINSSQMTDKEAKAFRIRFEGIAPTAKFSDWFNNAWQSVGDFLGGSSTTVVLPVTQQQTSTSSLPTWAIIATVVGGLTGIIIFRKFTVVVVAIIVIVIGIFLYGIFVRNTSTTVTGGGTTTEGHGGVGATFLNWLGGALGSIGSGIGSLFGGGDSGGNNLPGIEDYR